MSEPSLIQREWLQELLPVEARMRCWYERRGKRLVRYLVQLEIFHQDVWRAVVRFDNAHGFCHRDDIHPDGSQDKTAIFVGDANETFTQAVKEVQSNWELHRNRYLREIQK
jgi:hypothetical protein